jgi:pyruvate dehydrogenase E2 component (dihydrolipoamide acetyltransferase)
MAEVIRMPKMSDTMTEGVIAAWHKKVGDKVKSGELLAEVDTDKATMELESYENGTILYIGPKVKEAVAIDAIIAIVGKEGEEYTHLLGGNGTAPAAKQEVATPVAASAPASTVDTSSVKATIIRMPKMSDTMTEGNIVAWHKKVGDKVKSGELMAEVATDKATMELESYEDGTLLYIGVEQGNSIPVNDILCIIGEKGADYNLLLQAEKQKSAATATASSPAPVAPVTSNSAPKSAEPQTATISSSDSRLKISPLAKKLAKDKGVDLNAVKGSGENGRIVKRDIEEFKPSAASATSGSTATRISTAAVGQESFEEMTVSQMRKTIARRLGESKFTAPHFYLTMEINMDKAIEARTSMNEFAGTKISFNDMVIKATAAALRQNPKVNSSWLGDKIRFNHHIHIGMAVAVEEGLLVPVIRFADNKSLSQISAETKELGNKAKNKQLQPSDWEGNTFTISNLGMFGIEEFTAIINPPDACILAVGGIKQVPIVKNGEIKIGNTMKVTLSCDHRVVDGAVGSAFLLTLKALLEDPIRILV